MTNKEVQYLPPRMASVGFPLDSTIEENISDYFNY